MHENFFMTKWWFYLNSVPFLYFSHTTRWHSDTDCDDCKCRQYVWSMCFGCVTALWLAKEKHWQRWIRRITCSIKRSAHQNKCMTNNMARQREQSQDKPAWEPFNTTWPQKLEASHWNITTLWAKTPVNCTGIRQSTCWTAPAARAETRDRYSMVQLFVGMFQMPACNIILSGGFA